MTTFNRGDRVFVIAEPDKTGTVILNLDSGQLVEIALDGDRCVTCYRVREVGLLDYSTDLAHRDAVQLLDEAEKACRRAGNTEAADKIYRVYKALCKVEVAARRAAGRQ